MSGRKAGSAGHMSPATRRALVIAILNRPMTGRPVGHIATDFQTSRQTVLSYTRTVMLMGVDVSVQRDSVEIEAIANDFIARIGAPGTRVEGGEAGGLKATGLTNIKGSGIPNPTAPVTAHFKLPERADITDDLPPDERRAILARMAQGAGGTVPRDKLGAIQLLEKLEESSKPADHFGPPPPLNDSERVMRLARLMEAVGPAITSLAMTEAFPPKESRAEVDPEVPA